jgi:hypothetical protein
MIIITIGPSSELRRRKKKAAIKALFPARPND